MDSKRIFSALNEDKSQDSSEEDDSVAEKKVFSQHWTSCPDSDSHFEQGVGDRSDQNCG
jgi:hypothetical protein